MDCWGTGLFFARVEYLSCCFYFFWKENKWCLICWWDSAHVAWGLFSRSKTSVLFEGHQPISPNWCSWYTFYEPPKTMKNKGFGHLKTRLFTIQTSKHVSLGGSWLVDHGIVCPDNHYHSFKTHHDMPYWASGLKSVTLDDLHCLRILYLPASVSLT